MSNVATAPIRVMVVDDSVVARGFIRRWIETEPGIDVVASVCTGREALDQIDRAKPDVVILDVQMPDMDGITALPLLLKKMPGLAVIMASTLTRRNAEVTMKALALGALDCIQKPEVRGAVSSTDYRNDLIAKIRAFGHRARRSVSRSEATPASDTSPYTPRLVSSRQRSELVSTRPFSAVTPRVLLIGSSTGGPQALTRICERLGPVIDQAPVLITQHMPPTFTTILAEHLARATGRPAREAEDGEPIRAGRIYIAPGHRHLRVTRHQGQPVAILGDDAPIHFCKPAVDALFSSAAQVWGGWVLGAVLTGMGSDGLNGGGDIVAAGGTLIAQDEASSVVWGMPGAVAEAGLCSAILSLDHIAPKISQLFSGGRP